MILDTALADFYRDGIVTPNRGAALKTLANRLKADDALKASASARMAELASVPETQCFASKVLRKGLEDALSLLERNNG